jgi:hypothetical protein
MLRKLVFLLLIGTLSAQTNPSAYLDAIRSQPSLLLEFLRAMPKGADLHNHLSGAIYAEDFIQWAAAAGLCLDRQSFTYTAPPCDASNGRVPATDILKDSSLYDDVIDAQSMRNFHGPESGHDHFFNAFGKYSLAEGGRTGDMLATAISQAAADRVSYLELMLTPEDNASDELAKAGKIQVGTGIPSDQTLETARRQLTANGGLANVLAIARKNLDQAEARKNQILQCGTPQASPACQVEVRYMYQLRRGKSPEAVFAEMLTAFELAKSDPRVVGIDPVMPEDSYASMHNFDQLMAMFAWFKRPNPAVHLSLHAGELWTGLVPPEGLCCHIRKSVEIAHAERIGHGVDIMFETDPAGLLREMAAKNVAVEINLTSNDLILGVRGPEHPFPIYRKFGVPVVISTDDEGVSRSTMTEEYVRAVRDYHLSYADLKQIVRNSLEYSFLQGKSLWADSTYTRPVGACAKALISEKPGSTCEHYLTQNPKARLQRKLESDFAQFEQAKCCVIPADSDEKWHSSVR